MTSASSARAAASARSAAVASAWLRSAVAAAATYEKWKENGVLLRAFFYIAGTHLFAGFAWLLFMLGEHAEK